MNTKPQSTAGSKPRMRWFQFRMRTLLILVTLVAIGLGLWPSWCDYRLLNEYFRVKRANQTSATQTPPPSLGDFRGTDIGHWLLMRSLQNEEEKSIGVVYNTFSDLKEKSQPMVPKLIEMLSHSDAKHRERAAMALSNIGPLGWEAVERLCELRGDLSEDMRVRACAVWALNRIDRQAEARFWKDWHVTVTPENPVARGPMRISGEFLLREQPALAGHPVLFHLRDVLPDGTILNVQSGGGTLKDKDSETITFSIDSQAPHAPGQFELEVQVIFSPVLKVPLTIAPATDEPPQFEKR